MRAPCITPGSDQYGACALFACVVMGSREALAKRRPIGNVRSANSQGMPAMPAMLTKQQMEFLQSMDTPTVCNVVEMVAPERRGHGYTVKHLFCPFPGLPPIVGFAKTVTAKAKDKVAMGDYMGKRLDYLDYIAAAPGPSIAVIEDLDDEVGYGAF